MFHALASGGGKPGFGGDKHRCNRLEFDVKRGTPMASHY
jgi:hypothetical protein